MRRRVARSIVPALAALLAAAPAAAQEQAPDRPRRVELGLDAAWTWNQLHDRPVGAPDGFRNTRFVLSIGRARGALFLTDRLAAEPTLVFAVPTTRTRAGLLAMEVGAPYFLSAGEDRTHWFVRPFVGTSRPYTTGEGDAQQRLLQWQYGIGLGRSTTLASRLGTRIELQYRRGANGTDRIPAFDRVALNFGLSYLARR